MTAFKYCFVGLSITSSWGNGHATTYRALLRELAARGHEVTFLERDAPWYASNRDLASPPYAETFLYSSLDELKDSFAATVREADLVIVGSYVPEGVAVGDWVLNLVPGRSAFYDIDTPVTLAKLAGGSEEYVSLSQIPKHAAYFSFTGGPTLELLERTYGSPCARALYCSVDPSLYHPQAEEIRWDLGYLGTYSADRQPAVERLLLEPARWWDSGCFIVAGPQYPDDVDWPANVERTAHLPPSEHRRFYNSQRFTLNVTRRAMIAAGWSPSVRLFEAAACGTPIITDRWPGLESVFVPGREILVADTTEQALRFVRELPDRERTALAKAARHRILSEHTASHRAEQLERYTRELFERRSRRSRASRSMRVSPTTERG